MAGRVLYQTIERMPDIDNKSIDSDRIELQLNIIIY
jgi:hypothetical protein